MPKATLGDVQGYSLKGDSFHMALYLGTTCFESPEPTC